MDLMAQGDFALLNVLEDSVLKVKEKKSMRRFLML